MKIISEVLQRQIEFSEENFCEWVIESPTFYDNNQELENYIMDENFNPYQDSWTDVKKMEELGITEEQKKLFRLQKFEEMERMRF